jgi:hypothetical protein
LRDDEIRFEIEFHKEPETIDEAVYHVVNFIQTRNSGTKDKRYKATRRAFMSQETTETDKHTDSTLSNNSNRVAKQDEVLIKILERLEKLEEVSKKDQVKNLLDQNKRHVECFTCHNTGHYARDCSDKDISRRNWRDRKNDKETKELAVI